MSDTRSSRRNFLRGRYRQIDNAPLRPPGATEAFDDRCTACSACAEACPEAIIIADADRRPVVDFHRGACSFCGACAEACPEGALNPSLLSDWPWRANVKPDCLSLQGVTCRACEDACDARAIRFSLRPGGVSVPNIAPEQCSGCGACVEGCPTGSIIMSQARVSPARRE